MPNKKIISRPRVAVAMSGGVDSSVAAALLKKQGFEIIGIFMQFWFPSGEKYGENRCCNLESWNEASKVAKILDFPIYKVNFGRQFKKTIVDEFIREYSAGNTPNPCVSCNKFIKFDLLFKQIKTVFKTEFLATGHYIKIKKEKGLISLYRPKDKNKDQTYFLYNLNQEKLKHLIFPLGNLTKKEVREIASKYKLPVHDKKDSQEVCFVGTSHNQFLQKYLNPKPGEIINEKGKVLGEHKGFSLYTIGQRSGIGISGGPWYVCDIDKKNNRITVTKDQRQSGIYKDSLLCNKANWISKEPAFPLNCLAQIRYRSNASNCNVTKKDKNISVLFKTKQRGIMPGQSIVFYRNNKLLGGAIIK